MNTLIFLFAQAKNQAIFEILALLLGAAIIGYVTAMFYYTMKYAAKIKVIESEKNELSSLIDDFNIHKIILLKSIQEKDAEIKRLIIEVDAAKTPNTLVVGETDDRKIKKTKYERLQLQSEKDEGLVYIAKRKHLLNYKSFGTAKASEMDNLKMISGISPFIEDRLHALDIYTFNQISKFSNHDIETINNAIEYFTGRIERDEWVSQAKELVHSKEKRAELLKQIGERRIHIYYQRIGIAKKEEADDLTIISGIGGWIKEKLHVLDIYTFRQISNFTEEDVRQVTEAIEYFPGRIERDEWIAQAQELVRIAGKKAELLQRIKDRKVRIYYNRLGIAHKHEANNLTLIKGIGLWIEERLNLLDIYTFEQLSKLTPADIETITEILEISPGRIDRENWVTQARILASKQVLIQAMS